VDCGCPRKSLLINAGFRERLKKYYCPHDLIISVTIVKNLMKLIARYVKFVLQLPREMRLHYVQREIEIGVYWLWRKLRRKEFRYPCFESKPGAAYLITKQIPGINITLFGKRIQLIVPVTLEKVEINSPDKQ
jgi:hypothetical protein